MTLLRHLRDDRGVTMIEVMIVSTLFVLLLGAALSALESGTDNEKGQQARHEALIELRQAMTRLTRDLRQAASVDVDFSNHDQIRMTTFVSGTETTVTYALHPVDVSEGIYELRRTEGTSPVEVLVTHMVVNTTSNPDPPFCYSFDTTVEPSVCIDGGDVPTPVKPIRITLAKDPEHNPGEPVTLATEVDVRNL